MRNYMTWGPAGVRLKPSSELTEEQAAAIESVTDTRTAVGGTTKVTLHSKPKAMELGAKLLGMTEEDSAPKGPITITIVYEDKRAINVTQKAQIQNQPANTAR
jgi:hypothetical protein